MHASLTDLMPHPFRGFISLNPRLIRRLGILRQDYFLLVIKLIATRTAEKNQRDLGQRQKSQALPSLAIAWLFYSDAMCYKAASAAGPLVQN